MEIFINQQIFNGKLENEKNIGEIYDGIRNWVEENNKFLLSCHIDGIEMAKSELNTVQLSSVNRVDFTVGEEVDVLQTGLVELDKYIDTIGNTLFGRDSLTETEMRDLLEGIEWIDGMLMSAKNLLHLDYTKIKPMGKGKCVEEILSEVKTRSQRIENPGQTDSGQEAGVTGQIDEFLEALRDLKIFVMDLLTRTSALLFTDEELKAVIAGGVENVELLKMEFSKVNELFQSGKDREAVDLLTDTSGKMNVLLTALISLDSRNKSIKFATVEIDGENFDEKLNVLNETFARVAIALEDNDIVTAGDVLEYELPEVLDEVIPFLQKINEMIQVN